MKKRPKQGLLVTFEGGEGAGKTTQIGRLQKWLKAQRIACTLTRQPGGSATGQKIRSILLSPEIKNFSPRCEVLLYAADRAQHVDEVVRPALAAGRVVISDRFSDSSVVYQGICRGLGIRQIRALNQFATADLEPDRVIVLDVPVTTGAARMRARGKLDRLELEKKAFHEKVRRGFLTLARQNKKRFVVIDGTQPVDEVFAQVLAALEPELRRKGLWKRPPRKI